MGIWNFIHGNNGYKESGILLDTLFDLKSLLSLLPDHKENYSINISISPALSTFYMHEAMQYYR